MTHTIDDVITKCQEMYGLNVTEKNITAYSEFIRRQLKTHTYYDLDFRTSSHPSAGFPYRNLLIDKLLLFSYLIGQTPVIAGYVEHTKVKIIKSIDDLYLLRPSEIRRARGELHLLYNRTNTRLSQYKKYQIKTQNWSDLIDELGSDEEVVRYFGRKINYKIVKGQHEYDLGEQVWNALPVWVRRVIYMIKPFLTA